MQVIINSKDQNSRLDIIQDVATKLITSQFFVWTCLVLLISHKNWKRPIIILMVFHWIFRSIGDMLEACLTLFEQKDPRWPFSNEAWLYSYGVASIFWFSSEIIGDWYLFIRTKALVKKHKIKWVFITCLLYNIVKIFQMYVFLSYVPFSKGYNNDDPNHGDQYVLDMATHKYYKWIDVGLQQIFSVAYDITVIIALKNNVFNKLNSKNFNDQNGKTFLQKFKLISEYRIYLSIIVTLIGAPFIFGFCYEVIYLRNKAYSFGEHEKLKYLGDNVNDMVIDPIRVRILNFNYIFMYIDQIMLRFYVEKNIESKKNSSRNTSKGSFSYHMIQYDYKSNDKIEHPPKSIYDQSNFIDHVNMLNYDKPNVTEHPNMTYYDKPYIIDNNKITYTNNKYYNNNHIV
jgi:hypothetical protein